MKKFYLERARVALLAIATLLAMVLPEAAPAQVVTQLPVVVTPNTMKDLGNGPQELRILQGSIQLFTSQGSGTGSTSGSSTQLTLTATPSTPPCVGCALSGTGITAGTTVSSYNGTTIIGMSAAMTVAASTAVAWGAACPSSLGSVSAILAGAGSADNDLPMYTYARLCAWQQYGPGAVILPFAIGAH